MAAALRREGLDVKTVSGPYGSFKVLVDDDPVVDGGPLAFLGILPSLRTIRARVLARLGRTSRPDGIPDRDT